MPLSGDLSDPGIEPTSLMSPVLAGRFFNMSATWEPFCIRRMRKITTPQPTSQGSSDNLRSFVNQNVLYSSGGEGYFYQKGVKSH